MRWGWIMACACVGVGSAAIAAPALREEQAALVAARQQSVAARQRSVQLEQEARGARQAAARAQAQAAALAARIQESEADMRAAEARVAIIARLQAAQNDRLLARQRPIVRLTAALQRLSRRPPALALVQPGSVTQAVHVRAALSTLLPVIRARTAGLKAELARSRRLRGQAELAAGSLRASRQQLADRRSALERLESQQRLAARDLSGQARLEGQRAVAMGEEARDIVDLMVQLEVAGNVRDALDRLPGPMPRPGAAGDVPPVTRAAAASAAPYRLPVVGEVVAGLGEATDSGVRARGLTLAVASNAQLTAPAAGRIVYAGPYRRYGIIVIIDHDDGWTTLVTGLARTSVDVGNMVRQGQPIGTAATGSARRPRITVELRRHGRPVDIATLVEAG